MLQSFLPAPLHPAVVHMPMALTVLLPAFAIGAVWAIHRGARPFRAWGIALALFAALSASAWASLETGEQADEQVESVVPEQAIATHEDAAQQFLLFSVVVLGVAALGLIRGRIGNVSRFAASAGTLGLLVAGWNVGHSGGALVYQYGASAAYTNDIAGTTGTTGIQGRSATDAISAGTLTAATGVGSSTAADDDDDDDDGDGK